MGELTPMTVAGIMSGTSADGIDVAFTRITPDAKSAAFPKLKLLAHAGFPFPPALRRAVLAAMNAEAIATAELARLNWRLGQAYSEALTAALKRHPCRLNLIGCHGQTIYHQATPTRYLGREITCTWQIGEMAMLAAHSGVPVVSNFRPADMVVGGQGAPLVSLLDYVFFRHPTRGRVLQNLGGIGNLTALTANAKPSQVVAFDTGPANMIIDQLMQQLFDKRFDHGGKTSVSFPKVLPRAPAGSNSAATTRPAFLSSAAKPAEAAKIPSPRPRRLRRAVWAWLTPASCSRRCITRR
jgi:anhydro-N-acetylmuramic acid kinase